MKRIHTILLLSFVEGGSVMAAELLGAKMLAPFLVPLWRVGPLFSGLLCFL